MASWDPIEGETPFDRSCLKDKTIRTRSQLNVVEAENIRKAHVKYLAARPSERSAPFSFEWVIRLHREMFCDVWQWAGEIRTCDLNTGVSFLQVRPKLYDLVTGSLPFWKDDPTMPAIEVASRLHHQAVAIHPFLGGNGRWSRLLANIWLKQHGEPIVQWPAEVITVDHPIRQEYLSAVKKADLGDCELLVELHRRYAAS